MDIGLDLSVHWRRFFIHASVSRYTVARQARHLHCELLLSRTVGDQRDSAWGSRCCTRTHGRFSDVAMHGCLAFSQPQMGPNDFGPLMLENR